MYLNHKKIQIVFILLNIYSISKSYFKLKQKEKSFTHIPIAFSIDNLFTYPLIVLLTSILYNSKPSTFYYFHIMIPYGFFEENKQKINGLCKKYNTCKIIFLNMGQKYQDWKTYPDYYLITVYYRLSLSDLISNFDKIIYLDCDTMVHGDLTNFYNIEMGDNYYMGFPGFEISYLEINGTRNFINTGVMLINLKKLRKVNASLLFDQYYHNYGTRKVDEYMINAIFYNKISFLPFEYGIPDFEKGKPIINSPSFFWKSLNGFSNGTKKEMISASNNRIITHGAYILDKWWRRSYDSLSKIGKQWIYYASKSNVFNEICNTYIQYQIVCSKLK
jgi:hypothetical protein